MQIAFNLPRRLLAACVLVLCAPLLRAATIQVSAAASLTDALREISARYERARGDGILLNSGASSLVATQIERGAPADVFISADALQMDRLQARGLIVPKSRRAILSNTLVAVVSNDSKLVMRSPKDLLDVSFRNIAVAEPESVPAGIYAKQYLRKLGVWDRIVSKVVPTDNVRGALAAVESGNADVAIVYKTDALISKLVRIAYEVPRGEGPKIVYPAAVVADSRQRAAAQRFVDYLTADEARGIFKKYGFLLP